MVPVELVERLKPALIGMIIQDISADGRHPREMAPLCGRLITGVRWLNGKSRGERDVIVMLERAECSDEPEGLILASGPVIRLKVERRGWTRLTLEPGGPSLLLMPERGREPYTVMDAGRITAEMWDILRFARDNGGLCREVDAARFLGSSGWRAGRVMRRLEHGGWFEICRGVGRRLTPAGIELLERGG